MHIFDHKSFEMIARLMIDKCKRNILELQYVFYYFCNWFTFQTEYWFKQLWTFIPIYSFLNATDSEIFPYFSRKEEQISSNFANHANIPLRFVIRTGFRTYQKYKKMFQHLSNRLPKYDATFFNYSQSMNNIRIRFVWIMWHLFLH